MSREKRSEPERTNPQNNIKVLIDPPLRFLVVEAINIIDVSRGVGVRQMDSRSGRKKITNHDGD